MSIYVSGSLAFDRIMTFPGNFQDHILMDKLHMINVSFMVDGMDERRGGCAGNIAYSLALLGEKPLIVAAAGRDFVPYAEALDKLGLPLDGIRRDADIFTALCYITTDMNSNQITGFFPGALAEPCSYSFPFICSGDLAIVSPGNMDDMARLPDLYREKGVRFIFDPGQQLPVFTDQALIRGVQGSLAYVCNDYELGMTCKKLGISDTDMFRYTEWLITTEGEKGSRVRGRDGTDVQIPAAPCSRVADPTGAGDSHRAGLLLGLSRGLSVPEAAKLGSVSASYAIEQMGTQEHSFTREDFKQRYEAAYGPMPIEL